MSKHNIAIDLVRKFQVKRKLLPHFILQHNTLQFIC